MQFRLAAVALAAGMDCRVGLESCAPSSCREGARPNAADVPRLSARAAYPSSALVVGVQAPEDLAHAPIDVLRCRVSLRQELGASRLQSLALAAAEVER